MYRYTGVSFWIELICSCVMVRSWPILLSVTTIHYKLIYIQIYDEFTPSCFKNWALVITEEKEKKCPKIYYFCCLLCKIIYAIILILEYHYHRPSWWELKALVPKNNLLFLQNFSDMFCSCFFFFGDEQRCRLEWNSI